MSQLAQTIKKISEDRKDDIYSLKRYFNNNFPISIKALQMIDSEYIRPKRRKGWNLPHSVYKVKQHSLNKIH